MSTWLILIVGQSNERGTGGVGTCSVAEIGPPHRDPIGPNGYQYSMWPRLVDRLAREAGHAVIVRNTAEGSSSLPFTWIGCCVGLWTKRRKVARGTWVLPTTPNGFKYRCLTSDTMTGDAEPAWPVEAGKTVDDLNSRWEAQLADANDQSGHLYQPGESGFDPCGLLRRLQQQNVGTFDRRIALVSIGQSDAQNETPSVLFKDAYVAVAQWLLSQGFDVYLGMTCANPGYLSRFRDEYVPAIKQAIQQLGHPKVRLGADLTTAFGDTPQTHDGVHLVPAWIDQCSDAWCEVLKR